MSEKLTCKMSDGTEWEVEKIPYNVKLISGMAVVLNHIKRKPIKNNNLIEIKTFYVEPGTDINLAIENLAIIAEQQCCVAKMEFNNKILTAYPYVGIENNTMWCKEDYEKAQ